MNWNVQAVTITKTQGAKIRGEPTTIGMVEWNLTRRLPGWWQLNDKPLYSNRVFWGASLAIS